MPRRMLFAGLALLVFAGTWLGTAQRSEAQQHNMNPFFYYPYYMYPHNYWPVMAPPWPEPLGTPTRRPPAYQAFPPFKEPQWRYEYWEPHTYHRGFHFMLDDF